MINNIISLVIESSVMSVIIYFIFNNVFIKYTENKIDNIFDRNIEKYKNTLKRSLTAYELILNRELTFYEEMELYLAELIVLVQDLGYCTSNEIEEENYRKYLLRYLELIPLIKNKLLVYQNYIPDNIIDAFHTLIITMQDDSEYWGNVANILFKVSTETYNPSELNDKINVILKLISRCECLEKKRLEELTNIE